ncbi:IDEAL domain-containing protein [Bacillus sp. HMF5848]|uniref:IDEAL domain-containing protein n=1 Tax=Bacillus sp. HMF5848 TaxID=2495421 RepID=UPI000F7806B2|nr:IDEAL domain-containing protein [Bacillus sp. HMF5848]RSK26351.1 IDEAL domain-containing protein [Bacillus sp. HMF5848]
MNRKKSYSELITAQHNNLKSKEAMLLDTLLQMIIDEALFNRKKQVLEEKINDSLDKRDYEAFMKHSESYRKLVATA